MSKIFVQITKVRNALGYEQPITSMTHVVGSKKRRNGNPAQDKLDGALDAHVMKCPVCSKVTTRDQMCAIGKQLYDKATAGPKKNSERPKLGDKFKVTIQGNKYEGQVGICIDAGGSFDVIRLRFPDGKKDWYPSYVVEKVNNQNGMRESTTDILPHMKDKTRLKEPGFTKDLKNDKKMNPGKVDEPKWKKAKEMSQDAFGEIRWPFVTSKYKEMGGTFK